MAIICLVVAFYFGNRESCRKKESLKYIDAQIHNLKKYKHNLSDIIFVIAEDDRNETLIQRDENTGILYIYRKNYGLSFASWMKAVKTYKDTFDYYIFLEDDYCFVKDNFDQIMVNEFNRINKISEATYVVTWLGDFGKSTIGITSAKKMKKINYFKNCKIKHANNKIQCMQQFLKYMSPYQTIDHKYNAFPYWGMNNNTDYGIYMYGVNKNETRDEILNRIIVCAYQMFDENFNININYPFYISNGSKYDWIKY